MERRISPMKRAFSPSEVLCFEKALGEPIGICGGGG